MLRRNVDETVFSFSRLNDNSSWAFFLRCNIISPSIILVLNNSIILNIIHNLLFCATFFYVITFVRVHKHVSLKLSQMTYVYELINSITLLFMNGYLILSRLIFITHYCLKYFFFFFCNIFILYTCK